MIRAIGNGDRIDPAPRRIDVVSIPVFSNTLDWTDVVGRVVDYARTISNVTFLVDIGGQGEQFARLLERVGIGNIVRVQWGEFCFKTKNKKRFHNLRARSPDWVKVMRKGAVPAGAFQAQVIRYIAEIRT
ncbi:hypothetical protein WKW79_28905 [Variovorax robiniae]|uniref:Uncharacterized protein n=1 Tax=Variovorax robiniae TaxID=1836199 RepID=A0ABU8XG78_9BURK